MQALNATMETTKISLSRIVQLRVPVAWHEAVAITQGIGDSFDSSGATHGLDTCVVTVEGAIEIDGVSRNPHDGDLALHVLTLLIDRAQAPKELSTLVTQYQEAHSRDSIALLHDLTFFARPDRASAISAVATRAIAMEREAETHAELARLREVANQAGAPPPPPANRSTKRLRPWLIGVGSLAAAAGLYIAVSSMPVASAGNETLSGNQTSTQPKAVEQISTGLGALLDAGLSSLGLAPSATAAPVAVTTAPPASKAARPRRRSPQLVIRSGAPALAEIREAVLQTEPPITEISAETPLIETVNTPADDDTGLQPPVLMRPQLRSAPIDVDANRATAYLELLVNEFGRVDRVQLHASHSSLHDRMLLSAAKAWVFSPARENGQPVKYVLRVPLTPEAQQ